MVVFRDFAIMWIDWFYKNINNNKYMSKKIYAHTALPLDSIVIEDGVKYKVVENNEVVEVTLKEIKE